MRLAVVKSILQIASVALVFTLPFAAKAAATDKPRIQSTLAGHAVTGWNQRLGQPLVELPIVGKTSFPINGVCGAGQSRAIDATTPLSAPLCTHADPLIYKAIFNVEVTADFPLHQNVPLADFPQIYRSDGSAKTLPQVTQVPWHEASNGSLSQGYTVADWIKAEGKIKFVCQGKRNYYELSASHLVPGGLYTLWLFYFDQLNPPPPLGTGGLQPDLAFGGASANVLVADMHGRVRTTQPMGFCPQRWSQAEQYQPLNLHLVLHPEGRVYGTVAEQLLKAPHEGGPGVVALPQLMFSFPKGRD